MAKSFILKVAKVTYSPNAAVHGACAAWAVAARRSEEEVLREGVRREGLQGPPRAADGNYQLQAAALSDAQRMEASECFAKLEPLGASLRAAVDHYVAYLEKAGKSIDVRAFLPGIPCEQGAGLCEPRLRG
ncbi:MAG: hypothetical protein M3463_06630 [Verrucomicrobiota bacterium]|nr:hypothetical protein [Verrucomicrobiota bacterium]